jgi:hypothetical protein
MHGLMSIKFTVSSYPLTVVVLKINQYTLQEVHNSVKTMGSSTNVVSIYFEMRG